MRHESGHHGAKSVVWGLFLIGLGSALLAERFGFIRMPGLWSLWPLVVMVIGVLRFTERRPASGLLFLFLGAWFFACNTGWRGFSSGNSWPLVVVAVGLKMVIESLSGESRRRRGEGGSCCV